MTRTESRAGAKALRPLALSALLAFAPSARGDAGTAAGAPLAPSLKLNGLPRELHVGEHARFDLEVQLPPNAATPLLLTPFREGQALEVVKGRLLRSDARDPNERPLHFELPVLARAPGVARIGVRLLAYLCEPAAGAREPICRAHEVETRADVLVLP